MSNKFKDQTSGKKLSLYTTVISFTAGIICFVFYVIVNKSLPTKEEAIALGIIILSLNAVTSPIDLSLIIRTYLTFKYKGKDDENNHKE